MQLVSRIGQEGVVEAVVVVVVAKMKFTILVPNMQSLLNEGKNNTWSGRGGRGGIDALRSALSSTS